MNAPENLDIKRLIIEILPRIFNTMLSMEFNYADTVPDLSTDDGFMVGKMEFSGDVAGRMRFLVTNEFARSMTAAKLGTQLENVEEDQQIQNLVSEITNTVADHLETEITEAGFSCEHSPPSISIIEDHKTDVEIQLGSLGSYSPGLNHHIIKDCSIPQENP